ncbi:hypothetical protein [Petroclostridium xylanilyticum]|jgi:hypothetical protein|uniref:hypothetical protein n=1 Tax=Petroclostridium xylanilyticum TaxID=1792311 RepID=UPI000B989600|nr:hypothetical protein [Petroclostridium xylanilyticum]
MSLILTIAGEDKTAILKSKTLHIKRCAEGRNECSFSLITPYATYSPPIGAEVIVTLDNRLCFGGVIKERRLKRLNSRGVIYSSIKVSCQGYNHIPRRRTIQYNPDNISAGQAVRYMIENVLSEEGITEGVIEDGITLYNYDANCKPIRDILDDLAEACGFKWYIDDHKALHFLREEEVIEAPYSLIEGGAFTDFGEVEVTDTLEGYRNKQFVKSGDMVVVVENKNEIQARATVEGGTGVYGEVMENTTVQSNADALALADELLSRYGQHIPATLSFSTFTWGFDGGQRLHVDLPSFGASGSYLIEQLDITDMGNGTFKFSIDSVKKNFEKSSKRKENWVDYFHNIIKEVKTAKRSSSGNEGALVYSSSALTITSTPQVTLNLSPSVSEMTHLYLAFTITGTANVASQLTVDLQYNGNVLRTYKHTLAVGYNTFSVSTIIASVKAGGHSVKLLASVSSGTLSVGEGGHEGYIRAVGMAGIGTAPPEANVVEPLSYFDVGSGRVLTIDLVTITEDVGSQVVETVESTEPPAGDITPVCNISLTQVAVQCNFTPEEAVLFEQDSVTTIFDGMMKPVNEKVTEMNQQDLEGGKLYTAIMADTNDFPVIESVVVRL